MQKFVHEQIIARLRKLLADSTDEHQRRTLLQYQRGAPFFSGQLWSGLGKRMIPTLMLQSSLMPASAMTFFQITVSRAMWAEASAAVLASVSMPCWP